MCLMLIVWLLLSPAQQTAASINASEREAIEKAVLETSAKMTEAGEARDVDKLFSYMLDTQQGSIIQNGVVTLTRSEALQQVKKNMSGIGSIHYNWKQQHVTVLSPTVALLVSEGESAVTTEQGQSFTAPFAQTLVFVLSDGIWKAIHAHQSSPRR